MEVYVDGGIRRGTDVFKALARGAKAVFIGRPSLWGLAYKVLILELHYTLCICISIRYHEIPLYSIV